MVVEVLDLNELLEKMEKANIKKLSEIDNVKSHWISNYGRIFILLNNTGEAVFVQEIWDSGYGKIEVKELKRFKENTPPYFYFEGDKYCLDWFN